MQYLAVVSPISLFAALMIIALRAEHSRRNAILISSAIFTFALVALIEFLSIFQHVDITALTSGYVVLAIVAWTWVFRTTPRQMAKKSPQSPFSSIEKFCLAVIGIVLIGLLLGASFSPPNTWDAVQYHMPRVKMWAQAQAVQHFPTHYYVQLFSPPLAEFMILSSMVLSGTDALANLVQFMAFAGCLLAISALTRELGGDRKTQIVAAFLCATLPQGLLAATGAKNEWVLTYFLLLAMITSFRFVRQPNWKDAILLGIAAGAAVLTKGTAYLYLPPILISTWWAAGGKVMSLVSRKILLSLLLALLLNTPHWLRNFEFSGSAFGLSYPDVAAKMKYTVDKISLPGIVLNTAREAMAHITPPTDGLTTMATNAFCSLVRKVGQDPDDPTITNTKWKYSLVRLNLDEYLAGNPVQFFLILSFFISMGIWKQFPSPAFRVVSFGAMAAFCLYCALFKFELLCPRLHLPVLVILCAPLAAAARPIGNRITWALLLIIMLAGLPSVFFNKTRPLILAGGARMPGDQSKSIFVRDRTNIYFAHRPDLEATYRDMIRRIGDSDCAQIGLDTSLEPQSFEYPLFSAFLDRQFRYVAVQNLSSRYRHPQDDVASCAVVCGMCSRDPLKEAQYRQRFPTEYRYPELSLFIGSKTSATQ